jgi:hypothetical protein
MVCGVWKVTDIPSNEVGGVMANFELDAPQSVEKTQQSDGKWTVTATFPPCPPGLAGTNVQKHGGG